jgi:hypothetical protein
MSRPRPGRHPRHRQGRSRLHNAARNVCWSLAVLTGAMAVACLFAGAIWMAVQIPGRPGEQMVPVPTSPTPLYP